MWATVLTRGTSWRTLEDACTLDSQTCKMHETLFNAHKQVHITSPAAPRPSVSTCCPLDPTPTLPKKIMAALPKRIIKVNIPSPLLALGSLLVMRRGLARALSLSLFHLQSART